METILCEVAIKTENIMDAQGFHRRKRYAINQIEILVPMTREQRPGLFAYLLSRLFDAEHRAAADSLAKGNGYGVAQALGHERHRLRENEVRGSQHRGAAFEKRPGMQARRISPVRQRVECARIHKDQSQGPSPQR